MNKTIEILTVYLRKRQVFSILHRSMIWVVREFCQTALVVKLVSMLNVVKERNIMKGFNTRLKLSINERVW